MDVNMFCKSKGFIFLLFVMFFTQSSCALRYSPNAIDRTVKALEDVIDFYVKNVDKLNLDSIYGLRVGQGCLANTLVMLSPDHNFGNFRFRKLNSLHNRMKNAAETALPFLKEYQPDYYKQFKPIVDKPWAIFEDFRRLKSIKTLSKRGALFNEERFDEKISDNCMTEMIGTNVNSKNPCHVSLNCLKLMTKGNLRRYGTTHQVLYFLLGFQTGCRHIVEKEFQKFRGYRNQNQDVLTVNDLLEKKCHQILVEMSELKENLDSNGQNDLFLEQGFVCAILGYENFLDRNILKNISMWQDKEHGCFGKENSNFQEYDATQFTSRITMRKILYDRTLDNGCSSHETGVATGLLSIYLRWLLLRKPDSGTELKFHRNINVFSLI